MTIKCVGIIDYGMGNLASVSNALEAIGVNAQIVGNPREVKHFDRLILPGVGAFGYAMDLLQRDGLGEAVIAAANGGTPLLGICLGMQLLFSYSNEHGFHTGLGLLPGEVLSLSVLDQKLPVPNIGWCTIERHEGSRLLNQIEETDLCFYFVHGYYCKAENRDEVFGILNYNVQADVVVESGNIFGCQFHPEKSQAAGLSVLKRFTEI